VYGIIYKATGPSGLVYIGQTTESLKERKRRHQYRAYLGDRRGAFQIALLDEGFSAFAWEQIDTAENKIDLDQKERYWIAHYQSDNSAHGYNQNDGGIHYKANAETRRKMSESLKGKNKGKTAWNKGKHASKETRRKISEAHKGRIVSKETRDKLSVIHKGKRLTVEQRRKISEANKGHTTSEATRQKISATLKSKGILPPWIKNR